MCKYWHFKDPNKTNHTNKYQNYKITHSGSRDTFAKPFLSMKLILTLHHLFKLEQGKVLLLTTPLLTAL